MKFRRGLIQILALLLAAMPLLGVFAKETHAATSRVAVIKELSGTVQVKKAGGSKQFKAFAKMSLNEGDVLSTGANSSAVLQFANGTAEDDKMSVSANTTLTFSKLSDRSGTRTKVSMFNGSAWVDVKSIASKNDEFTLETPTAIMGVRGTHLLVSVDPVSGVTHLTVAAGVVHTESPGGHERDVLPTQKALITDDEIVPDQITIAPVDLELLMKQTDKSIVEAIVAASGEIVKENKQKLDDYIEQSGGGNATEQERQKSNIENLLGAIVDNAVKSGLMTKERVDQLVKAASEQSGVQIDLSKKDIQLTDEEKKRQDEQRKKEEEAARQAAEQKKKEDEERQKDADLQKLQEKERKLKEEANRKAEEEKKKKAEEEYQKQLNEADKKRFEEDKKKREQEQKPASPSPSNSPSVSPSPTSSGSPSPSPVLSGDTSLSEVTLNGSTLTADGTGNYSSTVPYATSSVLLKAAPTKASEGATAVIMRGSEPVGSSISLTVGANNLSIKVTAPNGAIATYAVTVTRTAPLSKKEIVSFAITSLTPNVTGTINGQNIAVTVPYGTDVSSLRPAIVHTGVSVSPAVVEGETYDFSAPKIFTVKAEDGSTASYTVTVKVTASNDTSLNSISINSDVITPGEDGKYYATVPNTTETVELMAVPTKKSEGASVVYMRDDVVVDGHNLGLEVGVNQITVKVTAPNGSDVKEYTVIITRESLFPPGLLSWTISESLNDAPIKLIYLSDGVEGFYSVSVDENTSAINMEMLFDDKIVEHYIVKNGSYAQLTDGDIQPGSGMINIDGLPLSEDSPYSTFLIEYSIGEDTYCLDLTVLRGEPELSPKLNGLAISYAEKTYFVPVNRIDETHFQAIAGPATGEYSRFNILPQVSGDEIVGIAQLQNGTWIPLDWDSRGGYGTDLPLDEQLYMVSGWYDYAITVWDPSMQRSKLYYLQIWRGDDIPADFRGVAFETDSDRFIGPSFEDPSRWSAEFDIDTQELNMKIKPRIPSGMTLVSVGSLMDGELQVIDQDENGLPETYYLLPLEGTAIFTFSSGERTFAYNMQFIATTNDLTVEIEIKYSEESKSEEVKTDAVKYGQSYWGTVPVGEDNYRLEFLGNDTNVYMVNGVMLEENVYTFAPRAEEDNVFTITVLESGGEDGLIYLRSYFVHVFAGTVPKGLEQPGTLSLTYKVNSKYFVNSFQHSSTDPYNYVDLPIEVTNLTLNWIAPESGYAVALYDKKGKLVGETTGYNLPLANPTSSISQIDQYYLVMKDLSSNQKMIYPIRVRFGTPV